MSFIIRMLTTITKSNKMYLERCLPAKLSNLELEYSLALPDAVALAVFALSFFKLLLNDSKEKSTPKI